MTAPIWRRWRPTDRSAVADLHDRALAGFSQILQRGSGAPDLADVENTYLRSGGEFLVGQIAGAVVAMGALRRIDSVTGEIKRMRIDPAHQRRGHGRALVVRMLDCARGRGLRTIVLDTTSEQVGAQRLSESMGFAATGTRMVGPFTVIDYRRDLGPGPAKG